MFRIATNRRSLLTVGLAFTLLAAAPAGARAGRFISGFEGDFSSTLGVDWVVQENLPPAELVPALTEGTQAAQVTSDPGGSWPAFRLHGGEALAQAMSTARTLVVDVAPTGNLSWRQVFLILNADDYWDQGTQFDLQPPAIDDTYDHVVKDLVASGWQQKAKAWLADPDPADREYFEFLIVIQGVNWDESAPQTIFDNIRLLSADFTAVDPQDPSSGYVDAADLAVWQANFGVNANGDADGDGDTDGNDFLVWQQELAPLVPTGAAAVPEPATAALLAAAGLALMLARRRRV